MGELVHHIRTIKASATLIGIYGKRQEFGSNVSYLRQYVISHEQIFSRVAWAIVCKVSIEFGQIDASTEDSTCSSAT